MSIQKIKEGNSFNTYTQFFLIDSADDLDDLEQQFHCNFGDEARTPDGTVYIRHSDDFTGDKWVVKSSGGSSASSNVPSMSDIKEEVLGEYNYELILDTTSFTTEEYVSSDETYYRCEDICTLERFNDGDIAKITFNGEVYEVPANITRYGRYLGEELNSQASYENYPFYIVTSSNPNHAILYTEGPGTYNIKIERKIITPGEEFVDAAKEAIKHIKFVVLDLIDEDEIACNYSRAELLDICRRELPYIATINGFTCSEAFRPHGTKLEFHSIHITKENNAPVLIDTVIGMSENSTPIFTLETKTYNLTLRVLEI